MSHKCESIGCARRDLLKAGAAAVGMGFLGLNLPTKLFLQDAYGITPDPAVQKYDALIQIFYSGGPSQTDTWDPKSDPNPSGYQSPNNVFPTLSLGTNDIYGKPIWLSSVFSNLAGLVNSDPASYGLGIVRSMHHGNGAHSNAQQFMNCFWQSPVGNIYPSTAAVMSYYNQGNSPLGIPAVQIQGGQGSQSNDSKGANITTALGVPAPGNGASPIVAALTMPQGVDAARYDRRKQMVDILEGGYSTKHPDNTVKAWLGAWQQAHDITVQGKAAAAFDLSKTPDLPSGTMMDPSGAAAGANGGDIKSLTLAQQLVMNGIPYVSVGIGGNDTHSNNMKGVTMNWGNTTDVALAAMAKNLKAAGKRVLVVMGGEFGRTPDTVAANGGTRRDGRDHHPDGFSWAMFSINQPAFKTTAVGDTGPDGMYGIKGTGPLITDPVFPGAFGGMVYKAMGYNVTDPKFFVPIATGGKGSPVDLTLASGTDKGNTPWLLQQFGLA